jgi:hypothetical protein
LRKLRAHNFALIKSAKSVENIAKLISDSLPSNAGIVRLHVGGDFFSLNYLLAVVRVAESHPNILFYSYTKSLHHLKEVDSQDLSRGIIRPNFLITGSYGGHHDHLIAELGVRAAYVVYTELEADTLPIDHDDSHAATSGGDFALLLHGQQKAGSNASLALSKLRKLGIGSYSKKKK